MRRKWATVKAHISVEEKNNSGLSILRKFCLIQNLFLTDPHLVYLIYTVLNLLTLCCVSFSSESSEAGKVKVTVEYGGSNGISIGFTFFEFIEDKYQGLLKEILRVVKERPNISNACMSPPETNESSGSGIQEATPCGAGGIGI